MRISVSGAGLVAVILHGDMWQIAVDAGEVYFGAVIVVGGEMSDVLRVIALVNLPAIHSFQLLAIGDIFIVIHTVDADGDAVGINGPFCYISAGLRSRE